MANNQNKLTKFWKELKRRKVIGVIIIYATTAFILMQLASMLETTFALPDWFDKMIYILLIIGFPVAIIFSWVFDVSSKGISKTESEKEPLTGSDRQVHEKSIAVLPFSNMSSDPEQEYFSDGIAEEIINSLTSISELKVIARTSAFSFKNQNVDVREIGRKLDVNYLLEGSVRKAGNTLRITAQLINIIDGSHMYSERFDRELKDIFEIQDEITYQIVDQLKINLLNKAISVPERNTNDTELYNSFLLARHLSYKPTEEDLRRALSIVEKIKEEDPGFSPAYQVEGFIYSLLGGGHLASIPPKIGILKGIESYHKAIDLDPDNAIAHAGLSYNYLFFNRDLNLAGYHIKKAFQLEPDNTEVIRAYAMYMAVIDKKKEAIDLGHKAIELDPLAAHIYQNLSAFYGWDRQYNLCIKYGLKTLEIEPKFEAAKWFIGIGYYQLGQIDKAIETWDSVLYIHHYIDYLLGFVYAKQGEEEKLKGIIERWEKRKKVFLASDIEMAYIYLGKGDTNNALKYLNSALDENPSNTGIFFHTSIDPLWDPLRESEEFKNAMKKLWR